eukprot:scaffold16904_cov72-Phaeocystis_antarctica.AAC.6
MYDIVQHVLEPAPPASRRRQLAAGWLRPGRRPGPGVPSRAARGRAAWRRAPGLGLGLGLDGGVLLEAGHGHGTRDGQG